MSGLHRGQGGGRQGQGGGGNGEALAMVKGTKFHLCKMNTFFRTNVQHMITVNTAASHMEMY